MFFLWKSEFLTCKPMLSQKVKSLALTPIFLTNTPISDYILNGITK